MDNELEDRLALAWLWKLGKREPMGSFWRRRIDEIHYSIVNRYAGLSLKFASSVIVRMTNTR